MTASESSDSDDYISGDESNSIVKQANSCLTMKPDMVKSSKSKVGSSASLRTRLEKLKNPPNKQRSGRLESRKQIEDCVKDIQCDFANTSKKLDFLVECVVSVFDRLETLEDKVESLLSKEDSHRLSTQTYAHITRASGPSDEERLDRLEYLASEEERRKRQLEVVITHPDIDSTEENLEPVVKNFLSNHMEMEAREIDGSMRIRKLPRDHAVLLSLSDRRFKTFLFKAKKNIRLKSRVKYEHLFVNDNITSYNYSMLKKLKDEKRRRSESAIPGFETVYCFEGRVYVKKSKTADALCVSNKKTLAKFIKDLDERTLNSPTVSTE